MIINNNNGKECFNKIKVILKFCNFHNNNNIDLLLWLSYFFTIRIIGAYWCFGVIKYEGNSDDDNNNNNPLAAGHNQESYCFFQSPNYLDTVGGLVLTELSFRWHSPSYLVAFKVSMLPELYRLNLAPVPEGTSSTFSINELTQHSQSKSLTAHLMYSAFVSMREDKTGYSGNEIFSPQRDNSG